MAESKIFGQNSDKIKDRFREVLVITDDQTWIWTLASSQLERLGKSHVRLPTTVPIRSSWGRFSDTDFILIHWEGKERGGGAIIEEILEVDRNFDIRSKVIVLTTNPTHEDVVYFSELGVRKIVRFRQREKDMVSAAKELSSFLVAQGISAEETMWNTLLNKIDQLKYQRIDEKKLQEILAIESMIIQLTPIDSTARHLDAVASLYSLRSDDEKAVKTWHEALSLNPNYVRSYHNLTIHYRQRGAFKEAYVLLQKMFELNKANIARMVDMGEIQAELGDLGRAEFYYRSALARDPYASRALNGLAEVKFHQGDLDASRQLLAKSQLAYKTAHNLNRQGVILVQKGKFQDALSHYTKAQYVLPQQDKGPLLLYNIALCYVKWKKPEAALEYVRLALIKDPKYEKASKLLIQLEKLTNSSTRSSQDSRSGALFSIAS